MKEKYFRGVNALQCERIDHFYGLLLQSKDLFHFLTMGLESLVACLNRPGGAINFYYPFIDLSPDWITFNIPEQWNKQFADVNSQLNTEAYSAYVNQTVQSGDSALELAAIFPLTYHGINLGVFALHGDSLSVAESDLAEVLCFTFSRLLLSQSHTASMWIEEKSRDILQTLEASQHLITTDPNQAFFNLLYSVRTYLGAEFLVFLENDRETPEIIGRRLLTGQNEWVVETSLRMLPEHMREMFDGPHDQAHAKLITDELLSDLPDVEPGSIRAIEYASIRAKNNEEFGNIVLINPKMRLNTQSKKHLVKACSVIANVIENIRFLETMKVNLAQLEVGQVELRNSRNNLRALFDNIPLAIYIVDTAYKIIIINTARSKKLSLEPAQLVGRTCYDVLYNRKSPCPACRIRESIKEARSTTRLWREWLSSETFVEWEIQTHPILDEMHTPFQIIVSEMDITEKRNLEANLIQSEKLAAVGQLAAGVAHEINNPLSAIIANAQILLQEVPKDNVDEVESLKLIETAGIRASQVVRNLLSISRKENLEYEPTDINGSIRNALVLVQHELLKRPITVKLELGETLPSVLAQQHHLQGVWINLLLNAIDAIVSTGRQDGVITIKTVALAGEIRITFGDNGQGIDSEKVKKVFEPFFTTKSVGHGTGLGLSVCMRVVKEHQGTISVESQPGQGTRFIITLPLSVDNIPD